MKKSLKRILAFFMAVIALFGSAQSAFAVSPESVKEQSYCDGFEDIKIEGSVTVGFYESKKITSPRILKGAYYVEIYSYNEDIIRIKNNAEIFGNSDGATIVEIAQSDRNHNYLGSVYIIAVVVNELDNTDGKLENVYDMTVDLIYKEDTLIWPEKDVDYDTVGDIYAYLVMCPYIGDATEIVKTNEVIAFARGSDTHRAIIVDVNGNYQYVDITFNVKYTFVQWIIIVLLFGWIWYI